ncbi:hypothetical protein BGW38_005496 [Lunasporangiospora selenospora]|uniref:NF-kappa-B-activating protein C-terminal domain-containing protein n=1 Tax=Lunasporangiospora selenospora TaxID=979761 RepID=A0A9P6FPV9_9FUNG|nr:hypothetical protein BGW38_005496 [Lunasporangiospora selenospora]
MERDQERGRSRDRSNSRDRDGDARRRPRAWGSGSRTPPQHSANDTGERRDYRRDYNDGPRDRPRAWKSGSKSRSRSRTPPPRAGNGDSYRGAGAPSGYDSGRRSGFTRRQSPSYDSYEPNQNRDSYRHGDRGRDQYSNNNNNNNNSRFNDYRRDDTRRQGDDRYDNRNGGRRTDQEYRGGRRAQASLPQFSDSRREQRLAIKFSIWAASPTEDELRNRSPSPDREVKKKATKTKSKRNDSDSDSDQEESRKRRRKSSKRSKDKHSSSSRHKSSRRSRRRSRTPDSVSEHSEDDKRSSRKNQDRSRRHDRDRSASQSRSPRRDQDRRHRREDSQERLKESMETMAVDNTAVTAAPVLDAMMDYPDDMWVEKAVEMPDDDMDVGPLPMHSHDGKLNERSYGGALLAGEGSAMAAYVQEGKRIPRRGEIGLESNEIANYESAGFVMSGSRHQRMNAVRVRKENQVISAEEKRALLIFNQEEKIKKDNKIINEMREMVASKLRSTGNSL